MSLTFGFHDSHNGDRKYSAIQFMSMFDGVITDGIFPTIYEQFMVSAGSGMTVNVASGRAWLKHTWTLNDATLPVTLDESEAILNRIDTIAIRVDRQTRENKIEIIKGTPSTNPVAPLCMDHTDVTQYPLCNIYIKAGATEITQADITNKVGTSDGTPFVEGVLPNLDIDKFLAQWDDEWDKWFTTKTVAASDEFYRWFSGLQATLEGDVAANLTSRVIAVEGDMLNENNVAPEMHRNIFRGKNLGTRITAEQKAAIRAGTFDDLYIGDYWESDITHDVSDTGETFTSTKVKWRIVDFDYWLGTGDEECTQHHVVIMPDTHIAKFNMNSTASTDTGYANSRMHTVLDSALFDVINNLISEMGGLLLSHKEHLTNAASNGCPSNGGWYESRVELPSEIMIYGHTVFAAVNTGSNDPFVFTNSMTQLALFRLCPKLITNRSMRYWLRDVVSATQFALVLESGTANRAKASSTYGIRPVFAIC